MNILRQSLVTFVLFGAAMIHARSARRSVAIIDDVGSSSSSFVSVAIALSPLAHVSSDGKVTQRQVDLWWWWTGEGAGHHHHHQQQQQHQAGDWVGLFMRDPSRDPTGSLLLCGDVNSPRGWHRTSVQFARPATSDLSFRKKCLGLWVGYVRDNVTLASRCFETQPTWMVEMRDYIGRWRWNQLFVPGTHDSGAYEEYNGRDSENIVTKYSVTQEETVLHQLIYGIRYLDIRVGYYPKSQDKFWVNHGWRRMHPLRDVINDVKLFMNKSSDIVLFDVQEFPVGFNDVSVHQKLMKLLVNKFSDILAPKSFGWSAPLNTFWNSGRRLIVGYDHAVAYDHPHFWQSVQQRWANVNKADLLESYMDRVLRDPISDQQLRPSAIMAEMTHTVSDVLTDSLGGLRRMADAVNRDVHRWLRERWWRQANIVAVDFFLSSNVVPLAIDTNWRRVREHQQRQQLQRNETSPRLSSSASTSAAYLDTLLPKQPLWHGPRRLGRL